MSQFQLKVLHVLENKYFQNAEVVAGHEGLLRIVKWAHVLEIVHVDNFLVGEELVLTTGISLQHGIEDFMTFIESLIEKNCAALCIEYGSSIQAVPEAILAIANRHQFPIIVFHEAVPFVRITQDLHSQIINQQYLMVSTLESYSQTLNKNTVLGQNTEDILQNMYIELKTQVMFSIKGREPVLYPNMTKSKRQQLLALNKYAQQFKHEPIYIFDQHYADLTLFREDGLFSEFELLILDRTATALAQLLIREFYIEEKKNIEDASILADWIDQKLSKEEIYKFIVSHYTNFSQSSGVVFILATPSTVMKAQEDIVYSKLYYRNLFEQHGFIPFLFERKSYVIFILLHAKDCRAIREILNSIFTSLPKTEFYKKQQTQEFQIAVGKVVADVQDIFKSYQTALETLYICRKVQASSFFYDDLHLYHLIYKLQMQVNLKEVINDYLQPVIEYDEKYNSKLLETLQVYLQSNGSKQQTANQLFIVRQTLYHRLNKLESLLGENFMKGHNRITLEFMLLANSLIDDKS
ncbi:PucR family transcriptional regulator ligand-binding domain-containing protein [Lysinibacillus sphaericus]|uniref:PucR family transcriptional regulator n=1 Tax=Lysinibacillus sphaericus TaxID=1421 RepID=UPI0025A08336|nr:PucR family transcriptional regulator [Lysinibacillus sphaericus]MDM5351619.1 PucR family transcriptional regulator ligand-binding domain-containing protein [Lysinibacillus sphaericus]